jgi:RimJ/RimL family protein N-acetyltransferase
MMNMHIISSVNVDLIEPFPVGESARAFKWFHSYRNVTESDITPKTPEDFNIHLRTLLALPGVRSFGVIDKDNKLNIPHEAPLIGMLLFEPAGPWNCYIHLASTRRAWGSGFIDEAITVAVDTLFAEQPDLQRISAFVMPANAPVKGLARRMGMRYEGCMRNIILKNGNPMNLLHFGITRPEWIAKRLSDEQVEESIETNSQPPLVNNSGSLVAD